MRFTIGILVFVPCAICLGIFAVENRQVLALEFTPLAVKFELPVAIWLLAFLGVGILVGLVVGFFSTLMWRRRARKAERLNRIFEKKHEKTAELLPPVQTEEALAGGVSPRKGSQSRSVLIND